VTVLQQFDSLSTFLENFSHWEMRAVADVLALRVYAWGPRLKTSTLTYLGQSAHDETEPAVVFVRIPLIVCSK